jgi:hypothetical protein
MEISRDTSDTATDADEDEDVEVSAGFIAASQVNPKSTQKADRAV